MGTENRSRLYLHLVDDPDDRSINRQGFRFGGVTGARSLNAEDDLSFAGPDRIDDDECPSRRLQAALILLVDPQGIDDEQFLADHRRHFLRRDQAAGDFGEEHAELLAPACAGTGFVTSFESLPLPGGPPR